MHAADDKHSDDHDTYHYSKTPSWFTRLLWYAAGADSQLLMRCPLADRVKFEGIGGVVVATALIAFASGSYAFYLVFGPKVGNALSDPPIDLRSLAMACFLGLAWALIIFNIDRFIVASTGKGDGKDTIDWSKEGVAAVPRIVLATIIGVCLSAPLEVRILKTEIDTELASRQKAERQRLDKATDARVEKDKAELTAKIDTTRQRLDGRAVQYETRRQEINEQHTKLEDEAAGISLTGKAGRGPAWQDKKDNLDRKERELEDWVKQTTNQDQTLKDDIARSRTEIDRITAEVASEKDDNQRAAAKMDGLMMRINISHDIGGKVPTLIMALLLSIELCPIFFKMMLVSGAYDHLAENQKLLASARYGVETDATTLVDKETLKLYPLYHQVITVLTAQKSRLAHEASLTDAVHKAWRENLEAEIKKDPRFFIEDGEKLTSTARADAPAPGLPTKS